LKIYKEGMSDKEHIEALYWERNMLAVHYATTLNLTAVYFTGNGWYYDTENNYEGFKRVVSLFLGGMCFHIPDDLDIGELPEIKPNWDGHTTEEKWIKAMKQIGCKVDE
jgi:hypothetical protein